MDHCCSKLLAASIIYFNPVSPISVPKQKLIDIPEPSTSPSVPPTNKLKAQVTKDLFEENPANRNARLEQHYSPEENHETTKNFTLFSQLLTTALEEGGFDTSFAKNLSYRIGENLRNSETSEDTLLQTIEEELGTNGATPENVQRVKALVGESLGRIAEMTGAKPSPAPF